MTARIAYNSRVIDFTKTAASLSIDYPREVISSMSVSRLKETISLNTDCVVSILFRNFVFNDASEAVLKRNLYQWKQWAEAGNAWSFAWDSTDAVITTLAAAVGKGSNTIQPFSISGVTAGGTYVLRDAVNVAVVKVSALDGSTLVLTETLDYAFAAGSRFRSEQYWPGRLIAGEIVEDPPRHWGFNLTFAEDMEAIGIPFFGMPPWMQSESWKSRRPQPWMDPPRANTILPV